MLVSHRRFPCLTRFKDKILHKWESTKKAILDLSHLLALTGMKDKFRTLLGVKFLLQEWWQFIPVNKMPMNCILRDEVDVFSVGLFIRCCKWTRCLWLGSRGTYSSYAIIFNQLRCPNLDLVCFI